jgi:hypothetical protein
VLHERTVSRLDALKEKTGAVSDSEVVRQALRLYELLIQEGAEGSRFFVGQNGHRIEVRLGALTDSRMAARAGAEEAGAEAVAL